MLNNRKFKTVDPYKEDWDADTLFKRDYKFRLFVKHDDINTIFGQIDRINEVRIFIEEHLGQENDEWFMVVNGEFQNRWDRGTGKRTKIEQEDSPIHIYFKDLGWVKKSPNPDFFDILAQKVERRKQ